MNLNKLNINKNKFDLNLKFYFWLKHLVKTKLSDKQCYELLEALLRSKNLKSSLVSLSIFLDKLTPSKQSHFELLISNIETSLDIEVFIFSLKLILIKDLLLAEAKVVGVSNAEELSKLDPLSLEYDNISVMSPYSVRVNGALISLLFFDKIESGETNFVSSETEGFIKKLSEDAISLKNRGIEPNQVFMLMFTESVNQSITSGSGTNYEDRILNVLINMGLDKNSIKKTHDKDDKSTEYDFFFEIGGKSYGIGAKRTLRERYKQFIKTALTTDIDYMIEITLGLDLNESKAKTITDHGTILFVSDEIYQSRKFLQDSKNIYSVKSLTLKTLKSL